MLSFFSAFSAVFIAEFGDRTQISLLLLSTRCQMSFSLFVGAALALTLTSSLAVLVGQGLAQLVPETYMDLIAAIIFLVFGIYYLFSFWQAPHQSNQDNKFTEISCATKVCLMVFFTILITETGDKTQILIATLASASKQWLPILSGSILALLINSALGIWLGKKIGLLSKTIQRYLLLVAALIFLSFSASKFYAQQHVVYESFSIY